MAQTGAEINNYHQTTADRKANLLQHITEIEAIIIHQVLLPAVKDHISKDISLPLLQLYFNVKIKEQFPCRNRDLIIRWNKSCHATFDLRQETCHLFTSFWFPFRFLWTQRHTLLLRKGNPQTLHNHLFVL